MYSVDQQIVSPQNRTRTRSCATLPVRPATAAAMPNQITHIHTHKHSCGGRSNLRRTTEITICACVPSRRSLLARVRPAAPDGQRRAEADAAAWATETTPRRASESTRVDPTVSIIAREPLQTNPKKSACTPRRRSLSLSLSISVSVSRGAHAHACSCYRVIAVIMSAFVDTLRSPINYP